MNASLRYAVVERGSPRREHYSGYELVGSLAMLDFGHESKPSDIAVEDSGGVLFFNIESCKHSRMIWRYLLEKSKRNDIWLMFDIDNMDVAYYMMINPLRKFRATVYENDGWCNKNEEDNMQTEVSGVTIELTEEQVKKIRGKLDGRWCPMIGEHYWFVGSTGKTDTIEYKCAESHQRRVRLRNVFRTREESEFKRERDLVLADIANFAEDENGEIRWDCDTQPKYAFYWDYGLNEIEVYAEFRQRMDVTYFLSDDSIDRAISKFGDRYKKYVVGVE